MPFVRPVTVTGEAPPVAVCPRFDVTVYEVIVDPPLSTGGVNETVTCPLPITAVVIVGALGTVEGVAAAEADELAPVPEALIAVILKV